MYNQICAYDNLLSAFKKARKGKTKRHYVRKFGKKLDEKLLRLRDELLSKTYKPKALKTFIIRDPKTRKISKSAFRDRVIHHALINIIGPIFENNFIYDSHANQKGKGSFRAVERFNVFKRKASKNNTRECYCLKADIKHYFEEVDHEILLKILRRKINDEEVIWLIERILDNNAVARAGGGGERKKGMPLGNHTSQFFANIYLNELDQYIKHYLKAKYYIRYVDDFVILHNSKEQLEAWREQINKFLSDSLRLELHPDKSKVLNLKEGITFLGFRIFYNFILIRKSNLGKFENKFKGLKILYKEEAIDRNKVVEHLEGWLSYARHANTYKYRRKLLKSFNKNFPIKNGMLLDGSKKTANFLKKLDRSRLEFSTQQTLWLFINKGLKPNEIALKKEIKESTVWAHFAKLIEYGQLRIWSVIPKWKIIKILPKIKSGKDTLKEIKERLNDKSLTFDEINCILAHVKFKEKIKNKRYKQHPPI